MASSSASVLGNGVTGAESACMVSADSVATSSSVATVGAGRLGACALAIASSEGIFASVVWVGAVCMCVGCMCGIAVGRLCVRVTVRV